MEENGNGNGKIKPGYNPKSLKNLKPPWKKGYVANPNGCAAPGWRARMALRKLLTARDPETGLLVGDRILAAVKNKAFRGDMKACEIILDRIYPKPKQGPDITINNLPAADSLNYLQLVRANKLALLTVTNGNGNGTTH